MDNPGGAGDSSFLGIFLTAPGRGAWHCTARGRGTPGGTVSAPLAKPRREGGAEVCQKWYLTSRLVVFWSVVKNCESLIPYLSDQ